MNRINPIEILDEFGPCDKKELIFEEDNRRLVRRFFSTFNDYCIETCQIVNGEKRWGPEFWNKSETKVKRRWIFDK